MITNEQLAELIGKPYKRGGRGPDAFDCYGLVMHLMALDGIHIRDYTSPENQAVVAHLMMKELRLWDRCEPKPGAGVMFRLPMGTHCGYVLPNERFIHCWEHSGGVVIERLSLWKSRAVGFYEYRRDQQG